MFCGWIITQTVTGQVCNSCVVCMYYHLWLCSIVLGHTLWLEELTQCSLRVTAMLQWSVTNDRGLQPPQALTSPRY